MNGRPVTSDLRLLLRRDEPILALAPMQDVTDLRFMRLISGYGNADVYFTEYFRVTRGTIRETQHSLVPRGYIPSAPTARPPVEPERPIHAAPPSRLATPYPSRPPRTLRELFGLERF